MSRTRNGWSIGMYVGSTPFDFGEPSGTNRSVHRNPVLWRKDIQPPHGGGKPIYLADPFLIQHRGQTYLFFEILSRFSPSLGRYEKGAIGYATCEDLEKQQWHYQGIALEEPFHVSYPYVFEHEGQMYMIPETHEKRSVRLYEAQSFPERWTFKKDLLGQNGYFADSGVAYFQDYWWLFTYGPERRLLVFYSRDLLGPYVPHARNPVVGGGRDYQRPAGRLLVWNGKLYRFSQQEGLAGYGSLVHAHEITELSPEKYAERPMFRGRRFLPINSSVFPSCWNRKTHHVDFLKLEDGRWLIAVDGDDRPCEGDPMQVSHYDDIRYAFRTVKASVKLRAQELLRSLGLRSPFRDPD